MFFLKRLAFRRLLGYGQGMADAKFDPVPELTEEEDAETVAAIELGMKDAREGRVVSLEDARRYIDQLLLNSSLPKQP